MKTYFPLVEAMLTEPQEGKTGSVAICTNTTAPAQVINEIKESNRANLSVLGTLIVSRDGGERMIVNSLSHPTLKYLVLFSEESLTFSPSTNLLIALMDGFEEGREGNYIKGGIAASAHYPSITQKIFDTFRQEIVVIPAFMGKHAESAGVVKRYLEWLKPKISPELHELLQKVNSKDKIYYDSLNSLLELLSQAGAGVKGEIDLDPADFQHLQPPKIELEGKETKLPVPFKITGENGLIRLDINIGNKSYFIKSNDPFLLEYSLMKHLGESKKLIPPLEQILLGAELGRVGTEIANNISFPSFVMMQNITGTEEIPVEANLQLVTDKRYYYKINIREGKISAMCLAFDVCESVFELLAPNMSVTNMSVMAERLSRENRFEAYEMDILHRMDIGTQLARAAIAAALGYSFIQDFAAIFKINKEKLPALIVEGDTFLTTHKGVLQKIYTEGITEEHGDSWKGLARTASVLAIYRNASKALETMATIYRQGDQDTATVRSNYKEQLLRRDHDGTYSYGQRTRTHFGFDQLEKTIETLKKDTSRATVIQRFDPSEDMGTYIDPDTGKTKFTHDPCLTHDIFFVLDNKLHAFHIARAHNIVNAYPENVFGLFDAYTTPIARELGVEIGDMYMLSNRANILLLTEEQRTKKILSEPSKPAGEWDSTSGPYLLDNAKSPAIEGAVSYSVQNMVEETLRPDSEVLDRLENYQGQNTADKLIEYLRSKGSMHNNTVLSQYYAGADDPQADQLVFFQANVFGKKVYATAVFQNRSISKKEEDTKWSNYISTLLAKELGVGLGELSLYYVGYKL
jgi:thymidylate synthase